MHLGFVGFLLVASAATCTGQTRGGCSPAVDRAPFLANNLSFFLCNPALVANQILNILFFPCLLALNRPVKDQYNYKQMFGNHLGTGCENNNPGIDCVNRRYSTAKNTVYQAFISLGKTGSLMKCIFI